MRRSHMPRWLDYGLRYLATIEQPTTPTDGNVAPTWSNLATAVPCNRRWVTGQEGARTGVVASTREIVRLLWRGDLTPRMRIRFPTTGNDDVLEIESLGDPLGNQLWIECHCSKIEST